MDTELAIGNFVIVEDEGEGETKEPGQGIGKLVGLGLSPGAGAPSDELEIEYLASPSGPARVVRKARRDTVRRIELSPQTRVYCVDEKSGRFMAGRVVGPITSALALRTAEDAYPIRLPNGNNVMVGESQLFVRWARPLGDPLDFLKARVTDTPFFYTCRSQLVRHLAAQRAVFAGLDGLASAAVDLMEHQVATVRRVLREPLPRYVLADEAGLGKSIEAGALVRQHLLEVQGAQVLILAPRQLLPEWQRELAEKFFLDGDRRIVLRDEPPAPSAESRPLTLLIIDEAERYAASAFATDRRPYEAVSALTRRAPRLLLLTNTPVLDHEDEFLALLHLIDPAAYPLTDRQAFRARVRDRQPIAEIVSELADHAKAVPAALARLAALIPDDAALQALVQTARIAHESTPRAAQLSSRRALRAHLGEVHRIDRRLLRTRRDDPRLVDDLPQRIGVTPLACEDAARHEAFALVEAWRQAAQRGLTTERQTAAAELFGRFVEAALSHPRVLLRLVDTRLAGPEFFAGEAALLRPPRKKLAAQLQEEPRVKAITKWLAEQPRRKVVLFIDDAEVADFVCEKLRAELLAPAVVRSTEAQAAKRFEQHARVLVCDAAAEEGLNLQRSGAALLHYDLPLSPWRIEQRIARRDRIAAVGRLTNLIFDGAAPYEREWQTYLVDAVRVFHRSVAPLVQPLRESAARLRQPLFADGAAAIATEAARLADKTQGLDAELLRRRQQAALDALEPDADRAFFKKLYAEDEAFEETGRLAFEEWMVRCLQFMARSEKDDLQRYVYSLARPTLLPLDDALAWFSPLIDHGIAERSRSELPLLPCTFSRATAEDEHVGLMRIGHPLVDVLQPMLRVDERGCAYALYRTASEYRGAPQRFFGFDFVVEADLGPGVALLSDQPAALPALRRRADEALRVEFHAVWLDGALQPVRDAALLKLLGRPYAAEKRGGSDTNLRPDRWPAVDALLPVADWPALVESARAIAVSTLREDEALRKSAAAAAQKLESTAAVANQQVGSRIARLLGPLRDAEAAAAEREEKLTQALLAGVRRPTVRLDAAGVVYLSAEKLALPDS